MASLPTAAKTTQLTIDAGRYAGRTGLLRAVDTSRGLATVRLDDTGGTVIVQLANLLPYIRAYFYGHGWAAATSVFGEQYVRAALLPTD